MAKALKVVGKIASVAAVVLAFVPGGQPFAAAASAIAGVANAGAALLAQPEPQGGAVSKVLIDTSAPSPYVIGRTLTGGALVHDAGYGSTYKKIPNPNRSMVFVYSDVGPVEQIEGLYTDGTFAVSEGAVSGYYSGNMHYDKQLGARPEASALAGNQGAIPRWGSSYKLSGKAAGVVTMRWDKDQKKFSAGAPDFAALIRGVKVYDPRLDSTYPGGSGSCRVSDEATFVYSDNPALHALTYIYGRYEGSTRIFGVGKDIHSIDVPAFVEWANVCEANLWTAGGVIYEPADKWNNLKLIMQAGSARPVHSNGILSVTFDSPKVPVVTFTEDDLANGDVTIPASQSFRDRINGIVPRYRSPTHNWEYVPGTAVSVSQYVTEDGEDKRKEIQYTLCQSQTQAAQLAGYEIVNSRELKGITVPLKTKALPYGPGEAVTLDMPNLGLSGTFVIQSRSFDPLTAITQVTFQSETSGKHSFALGATTTPPDTPSLVFGEDLDLAIFNSRGGANAIETMIATSWARDLTFTANDAGEIILSNHSRVYPDQTIAVLGDTLTGNSLATRYSIYYDDPNRDGGAVTYIATTDHNSAQTSEDNVGRHFVGYITTPAEIGSPDTTGQTSSPPTVIPQTVPNALAVGDIPGEAITADLASLQTATTDINTALTAVSSEIDDLENDVAAANSNITQGLADAETARDQIEASSLAARNTLATEAANARATIAGELDATEVNISALTGRVNTTEADITSLETTKADASDLTAEAARIDTLTSRTATTESQVVTLQNTKADQTALTSQAQTIQALESRTSAVVPQGISVGVNGSIGLFKNELPGGPNDGEIFITAGVLEHPDLAAPVSVPDMGLTTQFEASFNTPDGSPFYILWTQENAFSRFTNAAPGPFVVVYYDALSEQWRQYESNSGVNHAFTPLDSDRIIASGYKAATDNKITSLSSFVNFTDSRSLITTLQSTKADATALNTEALRITALTSRVDTAEGDISQVESDITSLETTKADASALATEASRITALTSRVGTTETDISGAESDISSLQTTKANAADLAAEATRIDGLSSRVSLVPHPGIKVGISGSVTFVKNATTSGPNNGEIKVVSGYIEHPDITDPLLIPTASLFTVFEGGFELPNGEPFYLMFSVENVFSRFTDNALSGNIAVVYYNETANAWQWFENNTSTTHTFTPLDSDRIIAVGTKTSGSSGIDSLFSLVNYSDAAADIIEERTVRASADAALTSLISSLTSRVGDTESDITTLSSTKANASDLTTEASRIDALTSRIDTVETDVSGNEGDISSLQSGVNALQTTKADASALTTEAARIDGLVSDAAFYNRSLSGNYSFQNNLERWIGTHQLEGSNPPPSSVYTSRIVEGVEVLAITPVSGFTHIYSRSIIRPTPEKRYRLRFKARIVGSLTAGQHGYFSTSFRNYNDQNATVNINNYFHAENLSANWEERENPGIVLSSPQAVLDIYTRPDNTGSGSIEVKDITIEEISDVIDLSSSITSLQTTKADLTALTTEANRIDALTSRTDSAESDIVSLQSTKADDSALTTEAARIDSLTSRVTTTEGDISGAQSDISNLQTTKANASDLTTEAARITALTSRVDDNDGDILGINSNITALQSTKADAAALATEASRIDTLTSEIEFSENVNGDSLSFRNDLEAWSSNASIVSSGTNHSVFSEATVDNTAVLNAQAPSGGFKHIASLAVFDVVPGRSYRLAYDARLVGSVTPGTIGYMTSTFFQYDDDGSSTGAANYRHLTGLSSTWEERVYNDIVFSSPRAKLDFYTRPDLEGTGSVQIRNVRFYDVADLDAVSSSIVSLQTTKADLSSLTTEASRIDALTSRVDTAEGDISQAEGNITSLQSTKANTADLSAEALRIDSLVARTKEAVPPGIPADVTGSVSFVKNALTSGPNNGEIMISGGTLEHPDLAAPVSISTTNLFTAFEGSGTLPGDAPFYIMWVQGTASARFGSNAQSIPFVIVSYDDAADQWKWYHTNTFTAVDFTPIDSDRIVAVGTKISSTSGITTLRSLINYSESAASIVQEESARISADNSLSTLITSLTSTVGDNTADINSNTSAVASATGSIAQLQTDLNTANSNVSINATAISDHDTLFAAGIALRTGAGGSSSALELYSIADPNGSSSVARISGDNILLDGSVTAGKLDVTELSAITATIATMRSASTGQRIEYRTDKILVYDSSNQIRVKIGNLS